MIRLVACWYCCCERSKLVSPDPTSKPKTVIHYPTITQMIQDSNHKYKPTSEWTSEDRKFVQKITNPIEEPHGQGK
jgi:hypothetical protein